MKNLEFKTLDDVFDCYGRENVVAVSNLKQIIFYTSIGAQPRFVCESEVKPGQISAWFVKGETFYAYKAWMDSRPKKENNE